jgi:hypothetical protein
MAVSVPTLVFIVTRLNRRADPLPTEHTHRGRIRISRSAPSAGPTVADGSGKAIQP